MSDVMTQLHQPLRQTQLQWGEKAEGIRDMFRIDRYADRFILQCITCTVNTACLYVATETKVIHMCFCRMKFLSCLVL